MLELSKKSSDYTYNDILEELGLSSGKGYVIDNFMEREMKVISLVTHEDMISWLSPYSKIIIKHFNSPSELLNHLNWNKQYDPTHFRTKIQKLFGTTFHKAKVIHASHLLSFYQ